MATFIADASVTLPWCFEDEATAWTDSLLDRLRASHKRRAAFLSAIPISKLASLVPFPILPPLIYTCQFHGLC